MTEAEIRRYITDTFEGVDIVENMDAFFFFYNPTQPPDHNYPFATIVTNDLHDQASNLNRPDVIRLNIGVKKETMQSLFGKPNKDGDEPYSGYDYTALDQLMPHPVYASYWWICVLNPSEETFQTKVQPLLKEAYQMAVDRYNRRAPRSKVDD